MDLGALPAVDAAIGLFFFFFLLSLVCSAVNELIATALNWRANMLETALRNLLTGGSSETPATSKIDDAINQLYRHDAVSLLSRPGRKPSYIPASRIAVAMLDTFAPDLATTNREDVLAKLDTIVGDVQPPALRSFLTKQITRAQGDIHAVRAQLESTFDDVMDRASGWYKRKVQIALLIIAAGVALIANADTLAIGNRLLKDDAVRASVVAQATQQASQRSGGSKSVADVADSVAHVEALGLPLGWSRENRPGNPLHDWQLAWWLWKVLGLALTVAALSLGAPFWFDVLGKLAQLRGVGNREGTPKDFARMAIDRDDLSRITPPASGPSNP